jgi:hypothetical protein|nr:MAG TPA: hypothetical protein [Caudoviricetes sp.]
MSINRILMKPQGSDVGNALIMTMGQAGYQYGYSRYNATIGEVEGNVQHEGKAVTLVMLCYYSGYLDFAFNIDGVTSGSYNVTVNVTEIDTGRTGTITLDVPYVSYLPGFYVSPNKVPSDLSRFFTAANVGKKYKIEIVFN